MDVVAVDAAPGKASTVFDGGEFMELDARGLRGYLNRMRSRGPGTLVCWDAPLTGPRDSDDAGVPGDFTQRLIESFFRDGKTGLKTPDGVSVRGYGGCPHWTITRSLLGLPRVGRYDVAYDELPFDLLPSASSTGDTRPSVVEIHPGVAAWLWCRHARDGDASWAYKKDSSVLSELWEIIRCMANDLWQDGPTPANDDQFDAAVGYILGRAYVAEVEVGIGRVSTLGDRRTGSFLLPDTPDLRARWENWLSRKAV